MTTRYRHAAAPAPGARRRLLAVAAAAVVLAACSNLRAGEPLPPIDPQMVRDQDQMTFEDYRPIPGANWADSTRPARPYRIALVAVDFPDQPFVITLPKGSDPFGNPQVDPVGRNAVPRFYADFFLEPNEYNRGHTINGYWMEQSRGAFGITVLEPYGPYRMPRPLWEYGLAEWGQHEHTPDGSRASARLEPHADSIWAADRGADIKAQYDAVLRIYAGYDETGVWQEFGEMKFATPDDIPPEWGNPNPDKPRWVPTRYVPWTSWLAGAQLWGLSSMRQGENSGTITHEIAHLAFRIPDLNNNPYVEPYRRVAVGPWDMMDRGSFNGPGGPHMRWVVPPTHGAAMPAGLMLRNRLHLEWVSEAHVVALSRDGLAQSGLAVAKVTARAVEPVPGSFAGVVVRLDGAEPRDRTPVDDPATNPLSAGTPEYDLYTLEVVQRIGYDSFTPDNGVLLAKNKDSMRGNNGGPNAFNSFIWVIDANPGDMNQVDFVKPNGDVVMRTVADYRQLNNALFHAGLDSGSTFEWQDEHNRLHFYVVDLHFDDRGIRTYTLGVRSLDGAGPHTRGATIQTRAPARSVGPQDAPLTFTLTNTGQAADVSGTHAHDVSAFVASDIYRLSVSVEGAGWSARLLNALAAVPFGQSQEITVHVTPGSARTAIVTVRAVSESDPSRVVTGTWNVSR
jgi:M6 family metalloprotease-like protein